MEPFPVSEQLAQRLSDVKARIAEAARHAGRNPSEVQIIAVTKSHPAAIVQAALALGLTQFGENRVRESLLKKEEVGRGLWRMIGHLQSNKAREAVHAFDALDSVDSLELAQEISRRAEAAGRNMPVLLQVNVSGESSKSGVPPDKAAALVEAFNALPRLELQGLMTMAPFSVEPEKVRPVFAGLRDCRDRIAAQTGLALPELSMGMSHDFEIAVQEGATMVRLGTALFGARRSRLSQKSGAADAVFEAE